MSSTTPIDDGYLQSLMGDFLDESMGHLQQLNENLLRLEELVSAADSDAIAPDPNLLNDMFRAAHSLKGLSGMLRLGDINALTHKVENVFDAARGGQLEVSGAVVDVVYRAVGRLETMIGQLSEETGETVDCQDELADIESLLSVSAAARHGSAPDAKRAPRVAGSTPAGTETAPAQAPEATGEPQPASPPSGLAGVVDDDDIPAKYIGIFVDESELTLDELSATLLSGPAASSNETLLVGCHRLKGSAASIGLHRIARLAHFMEDLLQDRAKTQSPLAGEVVDAFHECIDAIRGSVVGLKSGAGVDELDDACRQLLAAGTRAAALTAPATAPASPESSIELLAAIAALAADHAVGHVGWVEFEPGIPLVELKAHVLLEKLHQLGKLFHCHPREDQIERVGESDCLVFGLETHLTRDQLSQALRIEGARSILLRSIQELRRPQSGPELPGEGQLPAPVLVSCAPSVTASSCVSGVSEAAAAAAADDGSRQPAGKGKPAETLRVDIDRLDQLMNLAGQLVINKARFSQIGARLKSFSAFKTALNTASSARANAARLGIELQELAAKQPSRSFETVCGIAAQLQFDLAGLQGELSQISRMRTVLNDLSEAVHQLDRVSDGIQNTVMDTRMVPIGPLFARFKRVVRDLARGNDKQIALELLGESTELDKRMIDELGDPLIHLIRNSADHGIESPAERVAAGKPAQGRITLNAFHRGNRIVIRVSDDGRGLDPNRIRAKAIAKGLINEAEADRMTSQQIHQLIWQPGFSTAEQITEVSGRGMGMDIVRFKIDQLNGNVELFSEPGKGATFEFKLPLTMAILPSLMIVIADDVFAIPVESVVEIVRLSANDLPTVHSRPTARIRGRVISLVQLDELLTWNQPRAFQAAVERQGATLVIIGAEGQELGLVVDNLLGEQDVVIKSLEENFEAVEGIAGASILGDGRVSLILDVAALVDMARRGSRAGSTPIATAAPLTLAGV